MSRKLFGTDGIRVTANRPPMNAEMALKVAMATARHFGTGRRHQTVVIGKDTRLSGYMLEPALTAGFVSMGMNVVLTGPIPTPAVAVITRSLRAALGVVISASHNPFEDNGIKLFGADGYKLSDEMELAIEEALDDVADHVAAPADLGRARRMEDAQGRYVEFVKSSFPRGLRLEGLRIVVDCANGAAYKVAPEVFWELGAEVIAVGVEPNGFNINRDCGATHPERLVAEVLKHRADIGIALDGDADRVQLVDNKGKLIDGDQVMALIAATWHEAGLLKGDGVVATVMSNLGLERFLRGLGLDLLRAPVGDRYVVEMMRERGCNVGGEQSGHVILSEYTTTGDGLIAALQVLAAVVQSGRPADEVLSRFEPLPQVLKNVRFEQGEPLEHDLVKEAMAEAEARLTCAGRLLIRKSGTEPVIRVMAEGEDAALVAHVVDHVAAAIAAAAR